MREAELFSIFTSRLNKANINYFVTGAVASIVYGEPRLTHDIDLVVELGRSDAVKFMEAFPNEEFYCPPVEVIQLEAGRSFRGHFNLIHHETGYKADVYTLGEDELHGWGMRNRRELDLGGEPIWVASPEYVILRKLQYYREGGSKKHLRDIAGMLVISRDQMDFEELQQRIRHYRLSEEWEEAKALSQG